MGRLAVAIPVLLAGCATVGPDYQSPQMAVPEAYHAGSSATVEPNLEAWWESFGDPVLADLVECALAGNLDVQMATSRIREARARERLAGARGLPSVEAQGSATYNRISENAVSLADIAGGEGGSGPPAGIGFPGAEFETYRIGFDASWEIDLFGGTRRAVEAARARTDAVQWNRRDLELTVAAEVASAYLRLRTLQQRIAIAEAEHARQSRFEQIVRARTEGGLVSGLDLSQQQAELSRAASAIPPLRAQAASQIHVLGVLTGSSPDTLYPILSSPAALSTVPPEVPAGLPSELLRRRPDIREAERQLAAATADVGVAVADLYPRISLTAAPALVSQSLASLLEWGSRNVTAGAGITWPLFEGGRLRANVEVANARQEQALLSYRSTVLTALKDVEDSLTRQEEDGRQLASLERALAAAAKAEGLAQTRYRGGLVSLTDVLAAQARRISLEEQVAETKGTLTRDLVALYKALGGGWSGEALAIPLPQGRGEVGGKR